MTIIGSQTGLNGTCGKLYPARMRTSGLGWALGIGRLGAIVAPVLGGYLLARGLAPTQIFLVACVFALIAAAATALLAFRGSRVELPAIEQEQQLEHFSQTRTMGFAALNRIIRCGSVHRRTFALRRRRQIDRQRPHFLHTMWMPCIKYVLGLVELFGGHLRLDA